MSQVSPQERLRTARALIGDHGAFEQLVHEYTPRLLWFVKRLGLDASAAEDVVQDTWLTCWRSRRRLRDITRFRPWLYGIARNKTLQRHASAVSHQPLTDAMAVADSEVDESHFEAYLADLPKGLTRLPLAQREALCLRFLEGMTYDEIAQATGANPGTVKSRLYYAKAELKRQMEAMSHE